MYMYIVLAFFFCLFLTSSNIHAFDFVCRLGNKYKIYKTLCTSIKEGCSKWTSDESNLSSPHVLYTIMLCSKFAVLTLQQVQLLTVVTRVTKLLSRLLYFLEWLPCVLVISACVKVQVLNKGGNYSRAGTIAFISAHVRNNLCQSCT